MYIKCKKRSNSWMVYIYIYLSISLQLNVCLKILKTYAMLKTPCDATGSIIC